MKGKKHKLILIDDFDDFHSRYKKGLLDIGKISTYPVIYTVKEYPYTRKEFIDGSLKTVMNRLPSVEKPLDSDLVKYLRKESDLPLEDIQKIAELSSSFRSAVLALNGTINDLIEETQTRRQVLDSIKQRKCTQPITRKNIFWIYNSIKGYDKDALAVRKVFRDFSYRIFVEYEEIEPWFVNNMVEPIERVTLKHDYYNNKNYSKKSKKKPKDTSKEKVIKQKPEPKKESEEEEPKPKTPSLDKWL